ncbi:Protein-tyrosine phosphatase [Trichuris suis]|nr:Protein-tyrosine phosphatase [Trichuris suis]
MHWGPLLPYLLLRQQVFLLTARSSPKLHSRSKRLSIRPVRWGYQLFRPTLFSRLVRVCVELYLSRLSSFASKYAHHFLGRKLGHNFAEMNVLSKLREELLHYDKHRMWDSILEEIDRHTSSAGLTVKEGAKIENSDLNRYRNILPYDQTRVVLPESGYINANYVTLNGTDLDLILTQGPLLGTVGDFWKMVWNEHCENIIMLSGFVEGNRVMCHPYLPMNLNSGQYDTLSTETFEVKLVDVVRHEHFEFVANAFLCFLLNSEREVSHYYLSSWPDFDVPAAPDEFLALLAERCAFGIADPSTSSNGAASEAVSSSAVDQSSKEDSKLYSLASNTGVRNGPTESDGFCWRRYDERYMDRVRRRKMEAEKMRTRLMAMKEKMNREQDDRLFYYILFFLVVFALFVAFCLMLKPK